MSESYKTVYRGGEDEIVEKKSRFIASVMPAETQEDALAFIEQKRKEHWNARHHCFAYVIGERSELQRCSDDGEPGGTAGKPMLDVLLGEKLHNTVVVVTRYFGGTLLGTGGLVRAYSGAVKAGLAASTIITKIPGRKLMIHTDYSGLGKIQYILGQRGVPVLHTDYTDDVVVEALAAQEEEQVLLHEITEGTQGKARIIFDEACYFAKIGKETKVL